MNATDVDIPLSDLLDEAPETARLLAELGIAPHRHARMSLREVCTAHDLPPRAVLGVILDWESPLPPRYDSDWEERSLNDLIDHIVVSHHEYLRRQLPWIELLIQKAIAEQGDEYPELHQVREVYHVLRQELQSHLVAEEEVLFPLVQQLVYASEQAGAFPGTVDQSVAGMCQEDEYVALDLTRLRELTQRLHAPAGACIAFQSLMEELDSLEAETTRHLHVECDNLFPRAISLEQELMG